MREAQDRRYKARGQPPQLIPPDLGPVPTRDRHHRPAAQRAVRHTSSIAAAMRTRQERSLRRASAPGWPHGWARAWWVTRWRGSRRAGARGVADQAQGSRSFIAWGAPPRLLPLPCSEASSLTRRGPHFGTRLSVVIKIDCGARPITVRDEDAVGDHLGTTRPARGQRPARRLAARTALAPPLTRTAPTPTSWGSRGRRFESCRPDG